MSCSHDPQSLSKLELLPLSEKKNDVRGKSEKVELAQIISIFYKKGMTLVYIQLVATQTAIHRADMEFRCSRVPLW